MHRTTKKLFTAIGVLLLVVEGYNALIQRSAAKSQRQHLLQALDRLSPQTDCLFLGNSLVEAGCDLAAFQAAWPATNEPVAAVNIALGATSPVEHCLILERALRKPLRLKYLIYGFFDDQLNAPPRGDWSELVGNRAFAYYAPAQAAAFYAPGSTLKRWQLEATERLPLLAERSSLWGKVERLRRALGDIGLPRHKTNRFGRVDDFAALEAKDIDSFNQRCGAILNRHVGFSPPIRELMRLAKEHGAKVILVEMPMPSRHRTVFYASPAWVQMRGALQTLAGDEQATYIPASDWVLDDGKFEDATHLNEEGARYFSARLAAAVAGVASAGNQMASKLR